MASAFQVHHSVGTGAEGWRGSHHRTGTISQVPSFLVDPQTENAKGWKQVRPFLFLIVPLGD